MIYKIAIGRIQVEPGSFPTLVSDDIREDGKLVGNKTKCLPLKIRSFEKYKKSKEEKLIVKQKKKESIFTNKLLLSTSLTKK